MTEWTDDIESVLEQIRVNSVTLSKEHKKNYFQYNRLLRYFRLPVIIISGINSIVSVGFQPYLDQRTISMMTCLLALICSVIGSIELYLAIQKSMESELLASKDYYILSIDIHKMLTLTRDHRTGAAKEYLERKYEEYVKLFENSNLLVGKITDRLNPVSKILPQIAHTFSTESFFEPSPPRILVDPQQQNKLKSQRILELQNLHLESRPSNDEEEKVVDINLFV
jgi:hypothetical protein